MLRFLALLLCAAPLAASSQSLASEPLRLPPPDAAAWLAADDPAPQAETAARQQMAVVVRRADSCSSGSSSSGCDGGGCGDSDATSVDCGNGSSDSGCNIAAAGCIIAAGAGVYVAYRLLSPKRTPRRDSLRSSMGLPEGADALISALATRFDVTLVDAAPPTADVVLVIRETSPTHSRGVGLGTAIRRLAVRATDALGQPLVLADGPLPSAQLTLSVDDSLPEHALALAHRLASR